MSSVWSAVAACAALFVAMIGFIELGYRIGRRSRARDPDPSTSTVGAVEAAVFGLLGLILAFTFAGASDRLAQRRTQIVQEANAIGTAYLRIDLLPASEQSQLRDLFRRYLERRIDVFDDFLDRDASDKALDAADGLQRQIWSRSTAACQSVPNPAACTLVVPALNDMIDITTTRTMATVTHVPWIILALLVMLSLLGALLSGFVMSLQGNRNVLHMVVFSLAISATIYVVLDLEYPRAGLINLRSADRAMIQLRETMK
jgi:CDP-diglyceride synthetase